MAEMTATLAPSLAAWTAAFWPAGPLPMQMKSYDGVVGSFERE